MIKPKFIRKNEKKYNNNINTELRTLEVQQLHAMLNQDKESWLLLQTRINDLTKKINITI
tara:strand:- start:42264 stop:42443 length:180 start_codon:yes stop_codon:yes gene_type:complete